MSTLMNNRVGPAEEEEKKGTALDLFNIPGQLSTKNQGVSSSAELFNIPESMYSPEEDEDIPDFYSLTPAGPADSVENLTGWGDAGILGLQREVLERDGEASGISEEKLDEIEQRDPSLADQEPDPRAEYMMPDGVRDPAYMVQEFGRGVASMADLATGAIDITPGLGWVKHKMAQYFGAVGKDEPFRISYGAIEDSYDNNVLPKIYSTIGYDVDKLEARNSFERGVGLLSENFGAAGPIKLGQIMYRGWKGLDTKMVDDFTKTEVVASTAGGIGGGIGHSMMTTPEAKEQMAYLGNFGLSLFSALKYSPSYSIISKGAKLLSKGSGDASELSLKLVHQDIAKLIRQEDIPLIRQRMEFFKQLREEPLPEGMPTFTPTFSALVQTPHSRQIQRLVDTDHPQDATTVYENNKKFVNHMIHKYGMEPGGEYTEMLTEALFHVASQGEEVARSYARSIDALKDDIANLGRSPSTTEPLEQGQIYREQLSALESAFSKHIDDLYAAVDPENKILVPRETIQGALKVAQQEFLRTTSTGRINYTTDAGAHLLAEIKEIKDMFDASALDGTAKITAVKFNSLIELRKQLDRIVRVGGGIPGGTQATGLAGKMARSLDGMLDNVLSEREGVEVASYAAARAAYRDSYLPHFVSKDNVITKHLNTHSTYPGSTDFRVSPDELIKDLWQEGAMPRELNASQLNEMLSEASGIVDTELLNAASDMMKLKLTEHATASLNRAIRDSKNPSEAFTKWYNKNEVNIKNFPHVLENVDQIGRTLSLKTAQIDDLLDQEANVRRTLINKYSDQDAEKFVESLPRLSEAQAVKTLKELLYGAGVKSPYINIPIARDDMIGDLRDVALTTDGFIESLKDVNPELYDVAIELRQAVSQEVLSNLIRRGASPKADGGLNVDFFNSIFLDNNQSFRLDTLKQLLTEQDFNMLSNFRMIAQSTQDSYSPMGGLDFDLITKLEKELGLSIASASSRWYAQQLGKVGPVWLIGDTGVKMIKARHHKNMEAALLDIGYGMDKIEDVLAYRARMASGEEKEIYSQAMSRTQAFKKHWELKKSQLKNGDLSFGAFLEEFLGPEQAAMANRAINYVYQEEPERDLAHEYISPLVNGYPLPPEPSDEDWEEYRKRKTSLMEDLTTSDPLMIEVTSGTTEEEEETTNE